MIPRLPFWICINVRLTAGIEQNGYQSYVTVTQDGTLILLVVRPVTLGDQLEMKPVVLFKAFTGPHSLSLTGTSSGQISSLRDWRNLQALKMCSVVCLVSPQGAHGGFHQVQFLV